MAPRLFIKFLSKAIYCSNLNPSTCATCYLFEHCQIVVNLLRDAFHTPMIKITYTPHIFANFYTRSCTSIPQNKNSMLFMAFLSKIERTWAVKKKRKKRRELDTWRSKVFKRERKEIWTHEGPMCFKRKLAHVQKKIREK